jgi:hypothetical protein
MANDIGTSAVTAISVIFSGLIAGQMLAIALANYAARKLPETAWTLRFQVENKLFTKTMPPSLLLPILGLICSAFPTLSMQRVMFSTGCALEVIVLAITVTINIPINTTRPAYSRSLAALLLAANSSGGVRVCMCGYRRRDSSLDT